MPFIDRLAKFARSPQGKRALSEAQKLAKDPARRKQVEDLRRRISKRGSRPAA